MKLSTNQKHTAGISPVQNKTRCRPTKESMIQCNTQQLEQRPDGAPARVPKGLACASSDMKSYQSPFRLPRSFLLRTHRQLQLTRSTQNRFAQVISPCP